MPDAPAITTFLFTDIEGSTRLWEREPRMHEALARHDTLARQAVEAHRGRVVKTTGDGVHAAFGDPLDGILAAVDLQLALADPGATAGVALAVRCGLHAGADSRRDDDHYGVAVNRAARVMSAAHGGQILVSEAVATLAGGRLPEAVELLPLGSVRLRDVSRPEEVCQVAHPKLRREFPALRALEATPNNLPQQLTSFIGRESELEEVRRQLRSARLLTIVGIGGLGKSRLSLHAARDALADYPDGVWFVELAPIGDGRLVPQAAASVLGVKESPGERLIDTVARFALDRRLLLVLDNCEHLGQACAEFARRILEAAPGVAILATSRERLGIAGEQAYPLAPFPVPQSKLAPDAALAFASVRLFAERARAARPDFAITGDNAAAVAEICRRLDGIPLALELAAARVRAMPVHRIAERLGDRFKLLSGGDRTALPRQQTLRALIDWSYELLDPAERALFARLAVFAGGFTLEAAEKVAGHDGIDQGEVLDLLTRLVEKSLVALDDDRDRYAMLETVRQYAGDRLREGSEEARLRDAHLAHFLALAEHVRPKLFGKEPRRWFSLLDAERENLLAAHRRCDSSARGAEDGFRLARAMRYYCFSRGLLALGLTLTTEALARPHAATRNLARCQALSDAGQFTAHLGRHDEALRYLGESLAIAREIGDKGRIEAVLQPLAHVHLGQGDTRAARAHLEEALRLAREIDNAREVMAALSVLAQIDRAESKFQEALALCREVLAIARKLDDSESTAVGLINLAMAHIETRDLASARAQLLEAHTIIAASGFHGIAQALFEGVAGLAAHEGDSPAAALFLGIAEERAAASGLRRDAADEAFLRTTISIAERALGRAGLDARRNEGRALGDAEATAGLDRWLRAPAPARSRLQ